MTEILVALVAGLAIMLFGKKLGKDAEKKKQWKQKMDDFTGGHKETESELSTRESVEEDQLSRTRDELEEILDEEEPEPIDDLDDAIARFNERNSGSND